MKSDVGRINKEYNKELLKSCEVYLSGDYQVPNGGSHLNFIPVWNKLKFLVRYNT